MRINPQRGLAVLAVSLVVGVTCPATALAATGDYPRHTGKLVATTATSGVAAGAQVGVSGQGYAPGALVTLTVGSGTPTVVGTVKADATGSFRTTITLPAGAAPGMHMITATGAAATGGTLVLTLPVRIAGSLPHTGTDALPYAAGSVLAAVSGLALVQLSRRRARSQGR